ncbi:MAG: 4-hydroxythreonine-4-phosphate dehydrogenase PdxA [Myxococcales bacterium]
MTLPRLAVTLGDPSGIGPEVSAAALASPALRRRLVPVVFGDDRVWREACRLAGVPDRLRRVTSVEEADGPSLVEVTALAAKDAEPGRPGLGGARAQLAFLEKATDALVAGRLDGLCTAPLSKKQVTRAGIAFSGHTEYLAERLRARVVMMLAGPKLRVAVHTTHVGLRDVSKRLSTDGLLTDLQVMHAALKERFRIGKPRIAVLGLNPHAGEGGLFGDEEAQIIAPAIAAARRRRIDAQGPFPADGLFPRAAQGGFDAVLAMYHDQGLIPVKLLHFDEAVNVTLGLPLPRTSPDHGVAYDIAGRGVARPDSMRAALRMAAELAG